MASRRRFFAVIIIVLVYVAIEGISFGGLAFLASFRDIQYQPADVLSRQHVRSLERLIAGSTTYVGFDADLGWSIIRHGTSPQYQANSAGLRGSREYSAEPPDGVIRIAAFGDSFTHCDDVANDESWPSFLEAMDPRLEVLNFGVGGFGIDQAFLRFQRDEGGFNPDIVLIDFMSENIFRQVNTYRPFYFPHTGLPLAKPRFRFVDGQLELLPNPMHAVTDYRRLIDRPAQTLRELGRHDYFFQNAYSSGPLDFSPTVRFLKVVTSDRRRGRGIIVDGSYDPTSEAYRVTAAVIDAFHTAVLDSGARPVVLVFPRNLDIARYRRQHSTRYAPLIAHLKQHDYLFLDLVEVLAAQQGTAEASTAGPRHYTAATNHTVASAVYRMLTARGFVSPSDPADAVRRRPR